MLGRVGAGGLMISTPSLPSPDFSEDGPRGGQRPPIAKANGQCSRRGKGRRAMLSLSAKNIVVQIGKHLEPTGEPESRGRQGRVAIRSGHRAAVAHMIEIGCVVGKETNKTIEWTISPRACSGARVPTAQYPLKLRKRR